MKRQFLDMLENMAATDISTMPNYKTMLALAKHPEAYYPNPEVVAATIKINVSQSFIDDPELFEPTVNAYVKMLSRLYDQLKTIRPGKPSVAEQMFMAMIQEMSLTYTF